ncbi:MAG: bifunctional (p)ppGpp synthetase/guanosine-3',5'-bis(diphosphate) 3'-pyrophosphohydrolase [Acidobacteriota bacterium]|nr:bifunctional (p)ppGpp synthetase/guanosine-3',5'-bis(diphosphate) 3'-pyrophosphohydrolase [Acidobacteriota bacterium]
MIRFEDIQERMEQYRPAADTELLRRAYIFSAMVHRGQSRYSGEPYLIHPLAVAYILADLELDEATVATGLLHDTIEDAADPRATAEELQQRFGEGIYQLVDGVTKLKKLEFATDADRQAANLRKMILAMVDDVRVVLVKLADRLHNMRTLGHLPPHKQQRIAGETLQIYVPLANRLGLGQIKSELEDLSLRFGEPEIYQDLHAHLAARRDLIDTLIRDVGRVLEEKMRESGIEAEISGRIKSVFSIHKKMQDQGIDVDEVYDVLAFRLITRSVKDCYGALGIIHSIWPPVPGRIKDYIAVPKPNLYQSLHTSVMSEKGLPFEVQIRTREMHELAEHGIAAHWKYKERGQLTEKETAGAEWLRAVKDWQGDVSEPREFSRNLMRDLFQDDVHVFTPRGKVIDLPAGATPIDFAYAIHTEVGHRCMGAKVNGRLVPLKTPLANGDIVEVLTQADGKPSRDWLTVVRTGRARAKIRAYLRRVERERSIELGRSMLEKELRKLGLRPKALPEEGRDQALRTLKLASMDDLLAALGTGKITPAHFVSLAVPTGARESAGSSLFRRVGRVLGRNRGQGPGSRPGRYHGQPGTLLQPDSGGCDRGLCHPGAGGFGAYRRMPQPGSLAGR